MVSAGSQIHWVTGVTPGPQNLRMRYQSLNVAGSVWGSVEEPTDRRLVEEGRFSARLRESDGWRTLRMTRIKSPDRRTERHVSEAGMLEQPNYGPFYSRDKFSSVYLAPSLVSKSLSTVAVQDFQ
jgi:hypothetical protein